jgi:hypothetical protein
MNRKRLEEWISLDLDGMLPPGQQAELRAAEAADPSLAALRERWTRVGAALREQPVRGTPDPELAWQDVRRAIRAAAAQDGKEREVFGWRLGWVGAALAAALLLFVVEGSRRPAAGPAPAGALRGVEVEFVETDLPDASPMVYQDEESGWTIVWIAAAEPAETPVRGT